MMRLQASAGVEVVEEFVSWENFQDQEPALPEVMTRQQASSGGEGEWRAHWSGSVVGIAHMEMEASIYVDDTNQCRRYSHLKHGSAQSRRSL